MSAYTLTIGGQATAASREFDVLNPFDESLAGRCPEGTVELVDRAVQCARAALPAWSAVSDAERIAKLLDIASLIERHHAELSTLVTREQGKAQSGKLCEPPRMRHGLGEPTWHVASHGAFRGRQMLGDRRRIQRRRTEGIHHRPGHQHRALVSTATAACDGSASGPTAITRQKGNHDS